MFKVASRIIVMAAIVISVFFLAGLLFFGSWIFGLLWAHQWSDTHYLKDMLQQPFVIISQIVAFGGLIFMITVLRHKFWSSVDSHWKRVLLFCSFLVAASVLSIKVLYKHSYDELETHRQDDRVLQYLKGEFQPVVPLIGVPSIQEPLYFSYIDKSRIEELYSQIEPEMIEQQRKIAQNNDFNGKASATIGGVGAEIGGSEKNSVEKSLQRPDFTTERKCIELMKFAIEKRSAHIYTTGWDWFALRTAKLLLAGKLSGVDSHNTDRVINLWDRDLTLELKDLDGFVFLQGKFDVQVASKGIQFIKELRDDSGRLSVGSKHFPDTTFHVKVFHAKEFENLSNGMQADFRIFGFVVGHLSAPNSIDVRALAIY